jgi:hypothetical protein
LNDKDKNCNRQSNFADESSNSIQSNLQQKTHNMNQSCHIHSTRVLASNWGKNTQMETKSEVQFSHKIEVYLERCLFSIVITDCCHDLAPFSVCANASNLFQKPNVKVSDKCFVEIG